MPSLTGGCQVRVSSPAGLSTLITSAPRSASSMVAYGPASTREKSATSRPDSGPGGGPVWGPACSICHSLARCPSGGRLSDLPQSAVGDPACQGGAAGEGGREGGQGRAAACGAVVWAAAVWAAVICGAAWYRDQSALIAPA